MTLTNNILIINGGSSSIKFALYEMGESLRCLFDGQVESIDTENATLSFHNKTTDQKDTISIIVAGYEAAANSIIDWLEKQEGFNSVAAIGHRVVHGMKHTEPEHINEEFLEELKQLSAYAPEHLPGEIKLIELFRKRYPDLVQIACFDTAFHVSMPAVAKQLPLPRRFSEKGIQRYGFHGLSYSYLLEELTQRQGEETAQGRLIMAHLGNGASLAAVKDGKSMDTSMGFTPTAGLPMGTRTGDLDPGVAWYLLKSEKLNADEFSEMINHQSGLLGVSEISADMRALIELQYKDNRATEAIELFCYHVRKWIGSFAAVLGGLDTLVFSGGIGENAPEIRERVCAELQFLGIELDHSRNTKNRPVISTANSKVAVHVIKTNEELMIARSVCAILNYSIEK